MIGFDIASYLSSNEYPGRGIMLGRSADNTKNYILYFIMGRSENSRNRIFKDTDDGIKTEAFDPTKIVDPSLIIYHPVRFYDGHAIVTNGDQTDTILDALKGGHCFHYALNSREFEPDSPNYTPRISGLVMPDGSYKLSILKSADGDPSCCYRHFYCYDKPIAGLGHIIHTYKGDGNPIPSFEGEPNRVAVSGTLREYADTVWASLNEANKVSLYACSIDIKSGEREHFIINKNL